MKRLTFISLLLLAGVPLRAQQAIAYGYDAAGNRISKGIYFSLMSAEEEMQSEGDHAEGFSNGGSSLLTHEIFAAPNPTHGYLQVQVSGLRDGETCVLSLFDAQGRKVLGTTVSRELATLDLTALAEGLYLLRADIGEETTTVKIIRED